MKNMFIYAETIAILAAVAFVLHELVSVDLPWAVAIGAAAAVVVRTLLHRRTPVRPTQQ